MSLYYNKTHRANGEIQTTVRRHPERAAYDRETIDAILDEGLVGHLGFVRDGQPYVIPMLYARGGDTLYLHGAPPSRLLGTLAGGVQCCFTVTLLDGLVLARSAFRHSLNYRSVVVLGDARAVTGREQKLSALEALVEHVMPGRSDDARAPSDSELNVTEVVALEIDAATAKARTGSPADNRSDLSLPVWAGQLPLVTVGGEPIPDPGCSAPEPAGLRAYRRGHG
jgi:hypothetical protein